MVWAPKPPSGSKSCGLGIAYSAGILWSGQWYVGYLGMWREQKYSKISNGFVGRFVEHVRGAHGQFVDKQEAKYRAWSRFDPQSFWMVPLLVAPAALARRYEALLIEALRPPLQWGSRHGCRGVPRSRPAPRFRDRISLEQER